MSQSVKSDISNINNNIVSVRDRNRNRVSFLLVWNKCEAKKNTNSNLIRYVKVAMINDTSNTLLKHSTLVFFRYKK